MTKLGKFKTLDDIRAALDAGKTVYWSNKAYTAHYVDASANHNPYSVKDGKAIRVSCTSNYFGSLISESDIYNCFVVES